MASKKKSAMQDAREFTVTVGGEKYLLEKTRRRSDLIEAEFTSAIEAERLVRAGNRVAISKAIVLATCAEDSTNRYINKRIQKMAGEIFEMNMLERAEVQGPVSGYLASMANGFQPFSDVDEDDDEPVPEGNE